MKPAFPIALWCLGASTLCLAGCFDVRELLHEGRGRGRPQDPGRETGSDAGMQGQGDALELTLMPLLTEDTALAHDTPHEIRVLDAAGNPLDAPVAVEFQPNKGLVRLSGVPEGVKPSVHVVGQGSAVESSASHDTITLGVDPEAGERLLHVGTVGLAQVRSITGNYTPWPDRAALQGAVYWRPEGQPRQGRVGCAEVFLEGPDASGAKVDKRYLAENGLPAPELSSTLRERGGFMFGNLPSGEHTVRVSLDGGESFVASESFVIARTREEALGPQPEVLYIQSIDIVADGDPTPADCPPVDE